MADPVPVRDMSLLAESKLSRVFFSEHQRFDFCRFPGDITKDEDEVSERALVFILGGNLVGGVHHHHKLSQDRLLVGQARPVVDYDLENG